MQQIARLNSVANFRGKGRSDLGNDILEPGLFTPGLFCVQSKRPGDVLISRSRKELSRHQQML